MLKSEFNLSFDRQELEAKKKHGMVGELHSLPESFFAFRAGWQKKNSFNWLIILNSIRPHLWSRIVSLPNSIKIE